MVIASYLLVALGLEMSHRDERQNRNLPSKTLFLQRPEENHGQLKSTLPIHIHPFKNFLFSHYLLNLVQFK